MEKAIQYIKNVINYEELSYGGRKSLIDAIKIIQTQNTRTPSISVEEIEKVLKEKFNHLFSPEENYLGRLKLAQAIFEALKKKE